MTTKIVYHYWLTFFHVILGRRSHQVKPRTRLAIVAKNLNLKVQWQKIVQSWKCMKEHSGACIYFCDRKRKSRGVMMNHQTMKMFKLSFQPRRKSQLHSLPLPCWQMMLVMMMLVKASIRCYLDEILPSLWFGCSE